MVRQAGAPTGRIQMADGRPVFVRTGKHRGQLGRLVYLRRVNNVDHVYIQLKSGAGTWLAARSVDVVI